MGVTGLTKVGAGTFTLSGANTYTGVTTISAGTLQAGATNAFAPSSAHTVASGAFMDLFGFNQTIGSLAGAGTVTNAGAAAAALTTGGNATSTTFSGIIQDGVGVTGLTKVGAGTFTLSGANTYTGVTTISAGTLQAGATNAFAQSSAHTVASGAFMDLFGFNQTIGSLAGAGTVTNAGAAAAALTTGGNATSTTFSGIIQDGVGVTGLTKVGAGTFTLSGANTYTGVTTISAGTLQAGATNAFAQSSAHTVASGAFMDLFGFNQTIGSLAGAGTVTNAGAAAAALTTGGNATSTTFSGIIQDGVGVTGLTKVGAGTFTLSGANTYTGVTTISAGTLAVNGSIANSAVTVNTGATLQGTGAVGDLTVATGGIYAPGNSIGTMTVNGNFKLESGAFYDVEVNPAGQGDKVVVNGSVNLTGSILRVLAENGTYNPSTTYLIIDNDDVDPVVGTFSALTTNLAFLTPSVVYDAGDGNDVVLTLIRSVTPSGPVSFASVTNTPNQTHAALALDQFPTDNPLFRAVLNQTAEGARQAFDASSGEIHATVSGVLADDSRYVREAVLGRLIQAAYTNNAGLRGSLDAGGPKLASLDFICHGARL